MRCGRDVIFGCALDVLLASGTGIISTTADGIAVRLVWPCHQEGPNDLPILVESVADVWKDITRVVNATVAAEGRTQAIVTRHSCEDFIVENEPDIVVRAESSAAEGFVEHVSITGGVYVPSRAAGHPVRSPVARHSLELLRFWHIGPGTSAFGIGKVGIAADIDVFKL